MCYVTHMMTHKTILNDVLNLNAPLVSHLISAKHQPGPGLLTFPNLFLHLVK